MHYYLIDAELIKNVLEVLQDLQFTDGEFGDQSNNTEVQTVIVDLKDEIKDQ